MAATSEGTKPAEETPTPSKLDRARTRYPWLDHLVRAGSAFSERHGTHYAAAITYFSVLSLFPVLMVSFAVGAFILAGNEELLVRVQEAITEAVPGNIGATINEVVDTALDSAGTVGVLGLLTALYSGLNWIGNLRDALTAQWGQDKQELPFLRTKLNDLLALVGLGAAMVLSFGLSAAGGGLGRTLLRLVGLDGAFARFLLSVLTVLLSLVASCLVFLWVIARLPRKRMSARSAVKGAIAAAIGFEVLKQVGTIYLASVTSSPTGALFGPIIGVMVFANLVSQFVLFITAWTATASENLVRTVPVPPPAVIQPVVRVPRGPSAPVAAGFFGAGALSAIAAVRLRRRRR
ncbi:membrane protein [Tamaricihabitans halophyticus]|uniref:Membrane protein n=1 Tax=Tamaricihabitans halophyticus TaxID=1262583 RepID=A0A4R2QLC0_9PSEU|nr:inner membrane protein YhjD [Tamaricihabitans halophyticus]TCP49328.1 membrane protein [Tamaricihabitans halophyticus]